MQKRKRKETKGQKKTDKKENKNVSLARVGIRTLVCARQGISIPKDHLIFIEMECKIN